ncbi:hypothetical protein [Armatimonas sp.]|uniref:hypothetical protein n=1 Tax=Armatimonas sp. TaxID=1872638 RepID=UPI00286B3CE8|nr:hypothetical protein [Armatimonas sp.]
MSSGLQPLGGGLTPIGGGEEKKEAPPPATTAPVNPPGAPRPAPSMPVTRDFYNEEEDAGRKRLPFIIGGIVLALAA